MILDRARFDHRQVTMWEIECVMLEHALSLLRTMKVILFAIAGMRGYRTVLRVLHVRYNSIINWFLTQNNSHSLKAVNTLL